MNQHRHTIGRSGRIDIHGVQPITIDFHHGIVHRTGGVQTIHPLTQMWAMLVNAVEGFSLASMIWREGEIEQIEATAHHSHRQHQHHHTCGDENFLFYR